jgi:hypothetical protein
VKTGLGVPSESSAKVLPLVAVTSAPPESNVTNANTFPDTSYSTAHFAVSPALPAVHEGLDENDTVTLVVPARTKATAIPPVVYPVLVVPTSPVTAAHVVDDVDTLPVFVTNPTLKLSLSMSNVPFNRLVRALLVSVQVPAAILFSCVREGLTLLVG